MVHPTRVGISNRITEICNTLDHDMYLSKERRERLEAELSRLVAERDGYDKHECDVAIERKKNEK